MTEIQWNRTDLIDESDEIVAHRTKAQKEKLDETSGVTIKELTDGRVRITKVSVDENGEGQIGKKRGEYVTLSVPTLTVDDDNGFGQLEKSFLKHLDELHSSLKFKEGERALIIGLGNRTITPDAIGPYVIDLLHSGELGVPAESLIMYAPGVTGQTGYETSEFVAALAEKIKPSCIFVIDALATRASSRLCKTIQITDTGIHPGSGVGNQRQEISFEQLGVPVTAIGVPTVVDAPVLIADAVEVMMKSIAARIEEKGKPSSRLSVGAMPPNIDNADLSLVAPIFGDWATWSIEDRRQLFEEVFQGHADRHIVTPKEVDIYISEYARLITRVILKWAEQKVA